MAFFFQNGGFPFGGGGGQPDFGKFILLDSSV